MLFRPSRHGTTLALAALALLAAGPAHAQAVQTGPTFTVNTLAGDNDGTCGTDGASATDDCSLLEALAAANANADASTVQFSVTGTIVASATPTIRTPVTIDGTMVGGVTGQRAAGSVVIDGPDGAFPNAALLVTGAGASGSIVRGLAITRSRDGLTINRAARVSAVGNFIGTNAAGDDLGNEASGILVFNATDAQIGGAAPSEANTVGFNDGGIVLLGSIAGTKVVGNLVGTNAAGDRLGNITSGILVISSSIVSVGGSVSNEGNTISFNGTGIRVDNPSAVAALLGNAIATNSGLGIDLVGGSQDANGVTANDVGDGDSGANGLQNYPVITGATASGVAFTLNSRPSTSYRVEAFASAAPDASGFGEGARFVGFTTVTTDASGNATGTVIGTLAAGEWGTTTATPIDGDAASGFGGTSEFSEAVEVAAPPLAVCTTLAPLSFDFDGDGDGASVEADDFDPVDGGDGEFAGVRNESSDTAVALAGCSFISFDPFSAQVTFATEATATALVDADDTYVFATTGGDQDFGEADVLFDSPGAFALVTGPAAEGQGVAEFSGRVVAAVVYDRDREVFGSVGGGATDAERAAFAAALAQIAGGATADDDGAEAAEVTVRAWPNPVSGAGRVSFGLAQAGEARVTLHDALGRRVAVLADGAYSAGRHTATLEAGALPAGVYVVRVAAGATVETARLTVVR